MAYIPQDIFIINDSVKNNITLTGRDEVIDDVLLEDVVLRSRLKEVINNPVSYTHLTLPTKA